MLLPAIALALTLGAPPDEPSRASFKFKESRETLKSHGKSIAMDVFVPESTEPKAAVIVIHGFGKSGDEYLPATVEEAQRFAEAGYVAIVPHYFDRARPDPKNGLKNRKSYAQWSQTIRDVVGYATERDDVDPGRIGILGSSLGAWVAVSAAGKDRRVRALVEVFGGFPDGEGLDPANLPRTLILHGEDDEVVKVEEAYRLDELLTQAGVEHEMHIYPGAGHGFRGEVREDGIKRTLAFFDEHLKKAASDSGVVKKGRSRGKGR